VVHHLVVCQEECLEEECLADFQGLAVLMVPHLRNNLKVLPLKKSIKQTD
jgi:hypothetical protein